MQDLQTKSEYFEDAATTVEARSPEVTKALNTMLSFKKTELQAVSSMGLMKTTKQQDSKYRSTIKGFNQSDFNIVNAFIRSVINIDGSSDLFADDSDMNQVIYRIFYELSRMIDTNDPNAGYINLTDEERGYVSRYIDAYQQYESVRRDIAKEGQESASSNARIMDCVKRLNQYIELIRFYQYMNNRIRVVCDRLQTLKGMLSRNNQAPDKATREHNAHIKKLEEQLQMLQDAVDDQEAKVAIFKEVIFPSYKDGVRGFTYTCGRCGQQHFIPYAPMLVHHLKEVSSKRPYKLDISKIAEPTFITARALTFDPVVCTNPECMAINMFESNVILQLKMIVINAMNLGRYQAVGIDASSELKLTNSQIIKAFQNSQTSINESTVEEVVVETNPLMIDYDAAMKDYFSMVELNSRNTLIAENSYVRNVNWLKSLYASRPIVGYAVDELNFIITLLESAGYDELAIQAHGGLLNDLRAAALARQIKANANKHIGDTIYKDLLVTSQTDVDSDEFLAQIEKRLGETPNWVPGNEEERIKDIIQYLRDACSKIDFSTLVIQNHKTQAYAQIMRSGLFQDLWATFKSSYLDSLIYTVFKIIERAPNSGMFMQGKFRGLRPDKYVQVANKIRRSVGLDKGPQDLPPEQVLLDLMKEVCGLDSLEDFQTATGMRTFVAASAGSEVNIPYGSDFTPPAGKDDKVQDEAVRACGPIFSQLFSFEEFLSGRDIMDVMQTAQRPYEEMDDTEWMCLVYTVAYLFAHTVPVTNRGWQAIQGLIQQFFQELNSHDEERFKELNMYQA